MPFRCGAFQLSRNVPKPKNMEEIISKLKDAKQTNSFDEACELFISVFREVEMRTEGKYSIKEGTGSTGLYFYEYKDGSPFWKTIKGLRVIQANKHHVAFDECGNFEIYGRRGDVISGIILRKVGIGGDIASLDQCIWC